MLSSFDLGLNLVSGLCLCCCPQKSLSDLGGQQRFGAPRGTRRRREARGAGFGFRVHDVGVGVEGVWYPEGRVNAERK